jgi:glycosyltransferase involved in cell wall biosynthesis
MPLVSVIIPAFNAASTIERTIRSAQRQTLKDLEIIVIDDGSTDDTAARVEGIADERIVLRSFPNGGLPTARNRGIEAARGQYLAFLDADDLWSGTKLESHVAIMERRREVGAVYSWTCSIDEDDAVLGSQNTATFEGDVYSRILEGFFIGNASNAVLRREAVGSAGAFDPTLICGEDWEFLARVASGWHFAAVPRYDVFYRWRAGSMSSDVNRMREGLQVVCDRLFAAAPPALQDRKTASLCNVHVYIARICLTRRWDRPAIDEAARNLRAVLVLRPSTILEPTTLRLCVRWLIARMFSLPAATRAASWYHGAWLRGQRLEVDPWA